MYISMYIYRNPKPLNPNTPALGFKRARPCYVFRATQPVADTDTQMSTGPELQSGPKAVRRPSCFSEPWRRSRQL